jgi:geranylgeranyl diphosphate synthase, type I
VARLAKTLPRNPFLALLAEVRPEVDRRVAACLDGEVASVGASGEAVQAMLVEARALSLRGGKRLRAALVLVGQKATESRVLPWERGLQVGVAFELLQSYFLIHDDWMDQDDTRRGGPSVHRALSRRFRSAHAGACSAILAGDYMAALATRVLVQATRKHPRQSELLETFATTQLLTVAGQQLDAIRASADAEKVYQLKTGNYTAKGPLLLGAMLAGADKRTLTAIARFAEPVGIAFQLRDDLLGLFAKVADTGKPVGNDLLVGKRTWTAEWALAHAKRPEKRAITAIFGKLAASRVDVRAALEALRATGAEEATETRLRQHMAGALAALERARLNPSGEALLLGAARALVERNK